MFLEELRKEENRIGHIRRTVLLPTGAQTLIVWIFLPPLGLCEMLRMGK